MALLDLWNSSRSEFQQKQIHQVLAWAGTGKLGDGTPTSRELREFLAEVPSSLLKQYVDECLNSKFEQGGFVLQDLVNEIGRRLGFEVEHGRYRGSTSQVGNDGLWRFESRYVLIEVKTTDAYRINIGTIAGYRRELVESGKISADTSSILIVVGRQDTGDFEAQIRGSPYAWSVRLISVDALLRLLSIKESVDDPTIFAKTVDILRPQEFTRVDGIVELVFRTAEDIQDTPSDTTEDDEENDKHPTPSSFNDACMQRAEARIGRNMTKASRVMYVSSDGKTSAICLVSKLHTRSTSAERRYWYAFHRRQKEQLEQAAHAFVVLGCGSPDRVLVIPWSDFQSWVPGMGTTDSDGRFYWHVVIEAESMTLHRRRGESKIPLKKHLLP
jgi:hypothetical protein